MGFLDSFVEVFEVIFVKNDPHAVKSHGIFALQFRFDFHVRPMTQKWKVLLVP